jgi:hypothetical protein
VLRLVVILGFVGSLTASAAAGVPTDLPPVAMDSTALLVAERAFALFMIWLAAVIVLARALRNQLPVEISTRGVRYAEAEKVQETAARSNELVREMEADIRWLRLSVHELTHGKGANREGTGYDC